MPKRLAPTAYLEPPTSEELEDTRRTIRRATIRLKPGGIGVRWPRLTVAERVQLVDLSNRLGHGIVHDAVGRVLVAKASGECWWRDCVEVFS